jgi:cellulose synthase (UDP-forming)
MASGHSGPGAGPSDHDSVLLAAGTSFHRRYWLLGLIALLGTVGFGLLWPRPLRQPHPWLYGLVTLAVGYYIAVWFARWLSLRHMRRPPHREAEPGLRVAVVTSFVPEFESTAMLDHTVRRLVGLHYPHDTWVLDEGDDPAARELCRRTGARHFTRRHRAQYQTNGGRFASRSKHGNYNAWLDQIGFERYDIVVHFDPDHVPLPGYLEAVLGHFRLPDVGYVQPPQVYYNQAASLIARGAAEETYAYYSSHLMASYGLGHTIVIGSHSAHRVAALRQVGGFPAHDAEDLYLTMLYRANGWKGVYLPEILAIGTAPVDWAAYLRQQVRWARAVLDLKRNVYPRLAGRLTPKERLLNLFHGSYYLRPLILIAFYIVLIGMVLQNVVPPFLHAVPLLALAGLTGLLAAIDRFRSRFLLDPARERGLYWRALVLQAAKAPHLTTALIDVLLNRRTSYITTPKTRGAERPPLVLAAPHLALAGLLAAALGAGFRLHGALDPVLLIAALAFMGTSLALAWSELRPSPAPFDPELLAERERELRPVPPGGPNAGRAELPRAAGLERPAESTR